MNPHPNAFGVFKPGDSVLMSQDQAQADIGNASPLARQGQRVAPVATPARDERVDPKDVLDSEADA